MVETAGAAIGSIESIADRSDCKEKDGRQQDVGLLVQSDVRQVGEAKASAIREARGPGGMGTGVEDNDEADGCENESTDGIGNGNGNGSGDGNGSGNGSGSGDDGVDAKGKRPKIEPYHDVAKGPTANSRETRASFKREGESLANVSGNSSTWNPANTKVFDVYMDNGSSQTSQLLDIFACGSGPKSSSTTSLNRSPGEDNLELYNSGTGKRPHGFLDKMHSKKLKIGNANANERKQLNSLTLPAVRLEPQLQAQAQPPQLPYDLPNSLSHSAPIQGEQLTTFGQTDKWPSKMENAFIAALRLIIKNGTSKFKILEKNYGRNELISLFVQYHTGEIRTKKQISSHIQVWKKSISNKITSNFKVNPLDEEILQLIEEGAPQTNQSIKMFYSVFEEIVSVLSKQTQNIQSRGVMARDSMAHYPYLISPAQSATNPVPPFSHADFHQQQQTQQPTQQQQQQQQQMSQPATPLEYAKSIYGSLKTYKCVPVKVQDQVLMHQEAQQQQLKPQDSSQSSQQQPPQQVYINPTQKSYSAPNPILQSAKDLEYQQRQLIENLSHNNQSNFKLPSVAQNLYIRNLQPPPMPQQQNIYQTSSQPIVPGPISHYPLAFHQPQHSGDQVPAGLVLPPQKYYQQPQIYVPVSAPPGPIGNNTTPKFQPNPLALKDSERSQLSNPSSGSFSPSTANPNGDQQRSE